MKKTADDFVLELERLSGQPAGNGEYVTTANARELIEKAWLAGMEYSLPDPLEPFDVDVKDPVPVEVLSEVLEMKDPMYQKGWNACLESIEEFRAIQKPSPSHLT